MKVKIVSVHNQGDFDQEYVLLEVISDCDIGKYVLADTTYTSRGAVSNKLRHVYWFPDKDVKEGELVSLRTKAGTNTEIINSSGTKVHRFYWGLRHLYGMTKAIALCCYRQMIGNTSARQNKLIIAA